MDQNKLPLGYWLKKVDALLTQGIDQVQSSLHLTRTGWQVLNIIYEKVQIEEGELATLMNPFADGNSLEQVLATLKDDGIIEAQQELLRLCAKGMTLHKACLEKQSAFRQKAMEGISPQQYQETVATLEKMANNLDKGF